MNPLDKISAATGRIFQESENLNRPAQIRVREAIAQIRGALATIRAALDAPAGKPERLKLITGDEAPPPSAQI